MKKASAGSAATVAAYIAAAPAAARPMLRQLRAIVRRAAPKAEETISYRMPMYKHHGMLVGFAAFEHHVGFYAITGVMKTHAKALAAYKTGKGSVQFPLGERLPARLVERMVRERVAENEARAKAKAARPRKA